ncbi:VOC family protein, partial [Burkholderia gladioli]
MTVQDIAFVRYQVTDLDRMETFLFDFGLHRAARSEHALYMRATDAAHHVHVSELGPDNSTVGLGFQAASETDLERLAAHLGVQVEDNPEPGGGRRVRFRDPDDFLVDVLHGAARHAPLPLRDAVAMNCGGARRRLGKAVRLQPRPSGVLRLGHVALQVRNFSAMLAFYRDVLGFRVSDTYWAGSEQNTIAAFLHCGLGEQWTDHHTVALIAAQDGRSRFEHTAFEVLDLDDVMLGGEY